VKILLLTRYGRKGASSRLRFLQYLPYLKSRGIEVTANSLLDDRYLASVYAGMRPSYARIVASMGERMRMLLGARRYDLIWFEAELFPFLPAFTERRLSVPYVVDYDDAIFHRYDRHESSFVRRLLADKIDGVMRHSALVVVGNEYLAERAVRSCAPRVEKLPTAVDLSRYPAIHRDGGESFVVGWIGTPITSTFLHEIAPALRAINGLRLVTLGAREISVPGVDLDVRSWTEETETREIAGFDVGIMPLPDTDWERGKCGYKLIQYMASGLPVIASPVGINRVLVEHGKNGFLATTPQEWELALRELKKNAQLRKEMGELGRRRVEDRFCTAVTAPRLEELLRSALT
jgi:glycosyltransferase involved in cell wall biosynthesis